MVKRFSIQPGRNGASEDPNGSFVKYEDFLESTVVWNKFPDALPTEAKQYLIATRLQIVAANWMQVRYEDWDFYDRLNQKVGDHVVAWAEMPVYTEGE